MLRFLVLMTAAAILLAGCGGKKPNEESASADELLDAAPPVTEEMATMSLYVFDCGRIEVSDLDIFAMDGSYAGQTDTFTDSCFVIRHPKGDLLWDLGLPAALVQNGPQTDGPFTVSLQRTLIEQMAEAGLKPRDIDYVAVSHHHFDHVGQPEAAGKATWLVHQAEYDHMFSEDPPGDFSAFGDFEVQTFTGDYDVFGDGAIRILELPGHTPGHTALLLDMPEAGPVILSGDMYHRTESREGVKVPSFNHDADETKSSIERFEALAEASGAMVIIQHEPDDIARLPKPPEALR